MLLVSHNLGGGVEQHIRERTAQLLGAGQPVLILRPTQGAADFGLEVPGRSQRQYRISQPGLLRLLRRLDCREAEIHHWIDWPLGVGHLQDFLAEAALNYDVILHDYLSICPRFTLSNRDGYYCGEPDAEGCRQCLTVNGSRFGAPSIDTWRGRHGGFLAGARSLRAPSGDAARRYKRYFPDLAIAVRPHDDHLPHPPATIRPPANRDRLRVAILGSLAPHKGLNLLIACAADARARGLPLEFVLIGDVKKSDQPKLRAVGVTATGRYRNDEVFTLLAQVAPDIIFLSSLWPETFSYTLSIAQKAVLPVAAFDFGAIAERTRGGADTLLLPLAMMHNSGAVNEALLKRFWKAPHV